jgi:hypothetical protein
VVAAGEEAEVEAAAEVGAEEEAVEAAADELTTSPPGPWHRLGARAWPSQSIAEPASASWSSLLPRGVLIGTVELYGCDGGDWHLRNPKRAKKLLKPKKQPQPVWFYLF